jgi:hypothetical protein
MLSVSWQNMNKYIVILFLLLTTFAQGDEGDEGVTWPELSTIKFVSQRAATEADINEGAAVFLLQSEGVNIGSPMSLDIPLYAIHTDGETGEKSNVVIIQAEEANDQRVIGALIVGSNEFMAGLENEFTLLGKSKPEL